MKKTIMGLTALASIACFSSSVSAAEVKVTKGDTLYAISKKHGVTLAQLMEWNNLKSSTIFVGQSIKTSSAKEEAKPVPPVVTQPTTVSYIVKKGDTLWSISTKHKVTVANIQNWNKLKGTSIYVGQSLQVSASKAPATPVPPVVTPKPTPVPTPTPIPQKTTTYTVQKGDYLYKIATQFKITVDDLRSLNGLKTDMIYIGQQLKVDASSIDRSVNQNQLIQQAKTFMGVPYVWGGSTPLGFDCSGFIQYVYRMQGVSLPRTTQDMWKFGKDGNQMNVGDIVFFETYEPGPSHAGIYIGNGQFIHAGSSTGVTIASLETSYYKQRYLGFKSIR